MSNHTTGCSEGRPSSYPDAPDAGHRGSGASVLPGEHPVIQPGDHSPTYLYLPLLYRYARAERLIGPRLARRWLVLFMLYEAEALAWTEICDCLLRANVALEQYWARVHEHYALPTTIPPTWREVRALFAGAPLTAAGLRQWFRRAGAALRCGN